MLDLSQLHVFTARSNPLHWTSTHRNWLRFARGMLDAGVTLTVVECAFGEETSSLRDGRRPATFRCVPKPGSGPRKTLLNIGVHRTPEAKYIAWIDADIIFRRDDWALATLQALQHYDVVQPWSDAYDLGPHDEHIAHHHRSFCRQFFHRQPMVASQGNHTGRATADLNTYPHSGYAWATTRQAFDWVGGLFELGGMGSGDHHMSLALIGQADSSVPSGVSEAHAARVKRWEGRALRHINRNIGYVPGTIEHLFHGRKTDRGYQSRWEIFVKNAFDPLEDLKRNSHGVLEFASNKPELSARFRPVLAKPERGHQFAVTSGGGPCEWRRGSREVEKREALAPPGNTAAWPPRQKTRRLASSAKERADTDMARSRSTLSSPTNISCSGALSICRDPIRQRPLVRGPGNLCALTVGAVAEPDVVATTASCVPRRSRGHAGLQSECRSRTPS